MIDLNDPKYLQRLQNASKNPAGLLIIDFIRQQLDDLKFEKINTKQSVELIGQEFKAISETRKFITQLLDLLTPEKGD